jgi:hypothetical protein
MVEVRSTKTLPVPQNLASLLTAHTNVSCDNETAWELGATFFNYLNSVSTTGITGKIRFQVS